MSIFICIVEIEIGHQIINITTYKILQLIFRVMNVSDGNENVVFNEDVETRPMKLKIH